MRYDEDDDDDIDDHYEDHNDGDDDPDGGGDDDGGDDEYDNGEISCWPLRSVRLKSLPELFLSVLVMMMVMRNMLTIMVIMIMMRNNVADPTWPCLKPLFLPPQ